MALAKSGRPYTPSPPPPPPQVLITIMPTTFQSNNDQRCRSATRWQYWLWPTSHCHRHHWTLFQQPNRPVWLPVANLNHQETREGFTMQQEEEEEEEEEGTTKVFTNGRPDLPRRRHQPRCHGSRVARCQLRHLRGSRRQQLRPRRRLDGRCSLGSSLPLCPSPVRRYVHHCCCFDF